MEQEGLQTPVRNDMQRVTPLVCSAAKIGISGDAPYAPTLTAGATSTGRMESQATSLSTFQRPRSDRMRKRAFIHVDGIEHIRDRPFAREVAIAYLDGRPTASWLVMPEAEWETWSLNRHRGSSRWQDWGPDPLGLDPRTFTIALRCALKDVRAFAESHLAVTRWLKFIHQVAGEDFSISVRDAHTLVRGYVIDEGLWRRIAADASDLYPRIPRAASEATRLAAYVQMLNAHPLPRRDRSAEQARPTGARKKPNTSGPESEVEGTTDRDAMGAADETN
jgi:hypothetical protein